MKRAVCLRCEKFKLENHNLHRVAMDYARIARRYRAVLNRLRKIMQFASNVES